MKMGFLPVLIFLFTAVKSQEQQGEMAMGKMRKQNKNKKRKEFEEIRKREEKRRDKGSIRCRQSVVCL